MIKVEAISKAFGEKWAVSGVSLEVPAGEIFGLLGPNGAGKTTIIRMMTGLLMPTEGKISISGHDVVKDPIGAKSSMGYVPDRPFFYEKLTAQEFLFFLSGIRGLEKKKAVEKIDELTGLFGIKDAKDDLIEGYSQGMKQRLVFAAALLHNPGVLVIDEPFVGLDPYGIMLVKDVIKGLAEVKGVSVFLATHSLHIASELCHRVGFINKGVLAAIKQREEVIKEGGLEGLFMRQTGER